MNEISKRVRNSIRQIAKQQRDARYVFVFGFSLVLFILTYVQAVSNGLFDSYEVPLFNAINRLPDFLSPLFYTMTQFGGFWSLAIWFALGWYLVNRRAGLTVLYAGFLGYVISKYTKVSAGRGRPGDLLTEINFFSPEQFTGYGFPSGHATLAATCVAVLYYQVAPKYRKYLLLIVFMVGISRMYLGAHLPLDIVGGWALGAAVGSLIVIICGVSRQSLTAVKLKQYLRKRGYDIQSLRFANVDARGSRPVFITLRDGTEYFAKIFGKNEHAADWLFKIYRFFRFKNLQAEEPYVNSRRNVELEAFATLWAKQAGVRSPKIIDTIRIGKVWVLIQAKVAQSVPLSDAKNIRPAVLEDAWRQVRLLHDSNMAHRDLRSANLLVDSKKDVWIIDYGFAEVSPNKQRLSMDIAELLMSMSLIAGTKQTVDAARKAFADERLEQVMPYLQKAVFSGETTKQLKQNKSLLDELKNELKSRLQIEDEIDDAKIVRFDRKRLLNISLLAIFFYAIVPQISDFRGTLGQLTDFDFKWLPLILAASLLTYVMSGLVYVILADVPIKLFQTSVVQLAASFISKVVPGGLGSTAINTRYLHKSGLQISDASATVVSATAIGFIMFIAPLLLFLILTGGSVFSLFKIDFPPSTIVYVAFAVGAVILTLVLAKKLRRKIFRALLNFVSSLRDIATSPRQLTLASCASLGLSVVYILCLYACFKAFDLPLGFVSAVIVYATAVIAKTTVPTPGGLGPQEIAMVSSLLGLGIVKPTALAVVILYRLATFWLPIPFSLIAYKYLQRNKLI